MSFIPQYSRFISGIGASFLDIAKKLYWDCPKYFADKAYIESAENLLITKCENGCLIRSIAALNSLKDKFFSTNDYCEKIQKAFSTNPLDPQKFQPVNLKPFQPDILWNSPLIPLVTASTVDTLIEPLCKEFIADRFTSLMTQCGIGIIIAAATACLIGVPVVETSVVYLVNRTAHDVLYR